MTVQMFWNLLGEFLLGRQYHRLVKSRALQRVDSSSTPNPARLLPVNYGRLGYPVEHGESASEWLLELDCKDIEFSTSISLWDCSLWTRPASYNTSKTLVHPLERMVNTEASIQKPYECTILKAYPPAPVKPLDDAAPTDNLPITSWKVLSQKYPLSCLWIPNLGTAWDDKCLLFF